MKKFIYIVWALLFLFPLVETTHAQWSAGVSYEYRNEDPNSGFGLRVERTIFEDMPLLDLSIRGHFSYFNENTRINRQELNFSSELDVYDFGVASFAGFTIKKISPYVGVGIGNERFKASADSQDFSFKERNFYWNVFVGADVEILKYLKPFVEFRAGKLTGTDEVQTDNINRLAIGLNIYF